MSARPRQLMTHSGHQLARLLWHEALYRVGACRVGDAACGIRRQARSYPRLSRSTSLEAIAAIIGRILAASRPTVQKSSKSENVRRTVICRVSIASRPDLSTSSARLPSEMHRARGEHRIKAHCAHFGLDRVQRKSATQYIPRIGRDHATRANHPHHLCDAFGRIGNEEYHQAIVAASNLRSENGRLMASPW